MQTYLIILAAAAILFVFLIFAATLASRYVKVPPNQVLIVSGRRIRLPDGSIVGFRVVKDGGTFVFPIVEKADVLSLEVLSIEMPRLNARAESGAAVEADCLTQVKINGDDRSIAAATEHFLSKKPDEIKNVIRPILEKHLSHTLATSSVQELNQNPGVCAAKAQAAAAEDLSKMGLGVISVTIRNARAA